MVFLHKRIDAILKENTMYYIEMNNNQRRVFIDTVQLYNAFRDAFHKNRSYKD